ncbi:MAG: tetratricopeptide repeat protein [Alphaproteobacteria bacterium]|nr:tetratricopeptide repeat protein [Alphaproteobacteria bacterium]
MAETQPAEAQRSFRSALDIDPTNEEAAYGMGYTLLLQGKNAEATPWLCRVRNSRNAEIRQDATGMIAARQLSCP